MKKIFTLIVFFTVFLFKPFYSSAQAANVNDSLALVDLYNSTDGPNWVNNSGWLNGLVKNWFGVTLDNGGNLTQINLPGNSLTGSLTASLGNLKNLIVLNLSQNYTLAGAIPSSLNNLTNLQSLDLHQCHLSGDIPDLSSIVKLRYLDLGTNGLTGTIPSFLANLTQLQYLSLSINQLTGEIPALLSNLTNLQTLALEGDQLTGTVPLLLSSLSNLQTLNLSGNQLNDTIPASLGDLTDLQYLDLSGNKLSGAIPALLGNLAKLSGLFLNNNQLNNAIPASLGNLTNLGSLVLNNNQLSGNIPASLGNTKLSRLVLYDNQLSGGIPASFSNLNLMLLDLSVNKLGGTVPAFLTNIPNSFAAVASIDVNNFTFDGMEAFATKFNNNPNDYYGTQAGIPLHFSSNKLSVSAGGTLTNNIYKWYKSGILAATVSGDSTYKPTTVGKYSVAVTNSIATELTLYSDTIAITNAQLPITYLSFTAQPTHNGNLLQWQTATEINSAYFNIQRSTDGVRFVNIAQISAAGNSSIVQNYQYTDALTGLNPVPPALFYRVQEADKDGDVTYSKIIKLDNSSTPQVTLSIFPNPVHEVLNVQLQGITGAATISITDASGKTLQAREVNAVSGQTISINTQALAAGVYFIQVLHDKQGITQKFVKE